MLPLTSRPSSVYFGPTPAAGLGAGISTALTEDAAGADVEPGTGVPSVAGGGSGGGALAAGGADDEGVEAEGASGVAPHVRT
ncbi:MAG: hypothetical protein ACRELB_10745, partial [Polyangiaceae bacterium]